MTHRFDEIRCSPYSELRSERCRAQPISNFYSKNRPAKLTRTSLIDESGKRS
jgi:hypothetical protein